MHDECHFNDVRPINYVRICAPNCSVWQAVSTIFHVPGQMAGGIAQFLSRHAKCELRAEPGHLASAFMLPCGSIEKCQNATPEKADGLPWWYPYKKNDYFCLPAREKRGVSSVGSERMLDRHEVAGSIPARPTLTNSQISSFAIDTSCLPLLFNGS